MFVQTDNFGYGASLRARFHDKAYNYPVHIHQFAEAVVVLEGEIEILLGGSSERAVAGDIALISPFMPHGFITENNASIWIAVFPAALLDDLSARISECERAVFTASPELFAYVRSRLVATGNVAMGEENASGLRAPLYATADEYVRSVPKKQSRSEEGMLASLFLYLEEHHREPLSLSSVSSALGYSTSYISHALGAIPGINFSSLLSGIRVDHAKQLIKQGTMPINVIALECGFSCERSFHRAFSRLAGMTPSEYRSAFAKADAR